MAYHVLDGRYCQGIPLDQFDEKGRPRRLVYFYDSPEGNEPLSKVMRSTSSIAWVDANDDGSGWTSATAPRGANIAIETHGFVNLSEIYTRLVALHKRRDELVAADQGGATHGPGAADVAPGDVFAKPGVDVDASALDPADTNRDGVVDKAERKAAKKKDGE